MNEDIKNSETQQPISDEELDEASGGFGAGLSVARLPYTSAKKPKVTKMPYKSSKKPKATLL